MSVMTVSDLQSEEYTLVTTDYCVADILQEVGIDEDPLFYGAIVKAVEGEYEEIYLFNGPVPYLNKEVKRVK